jgi:hypothetical protein
MQQEYLSTIRDNFIITRRIRGAKKNPGMKIAYDCATRTRPGHTSYFESGHMRSDKKSDNAGTKVHPPV